MTSARQWVIQFLCLISLSSSALADGKVFARAVASPVSTPDQRAMLHFSNGVERLVIETSFVGQGTNFAWVVPLPSVPKIEAVSTNFFRNLNTVFQPKLIYKASAAWVSYLFLGSLIATAIWAFRKKGLDKLILVIVFLVLFLLFGMVLPSFVKARRASSVFQTSDSVNVLNRQTVGIYDTATVSGRDGRSLLDWLNTHGFHTPLSALPVISNYVSQGWVFAVAQVNRPSSNRIRSDLHPLAFTFSTEKPVYPLRLTGVENDHCKIELFVFGPSRAEAPGFKVEYCGQPFETGQTQHSSGYDLGKDESHFRLPDPGEYRISDPEVRAFGMPATVTTKLIGNLTAQDMQSDAWVRWVPFQPEVPVLYTQAAAVTAFLDCTVGIGMLGLLTLHILTPRLSRRTCERGLIAVLLLAATCGLARLGTAKVTGVTITHGGWRNAAFNYLQLDGSIEQYLFERKTTEPLTFDGLRVALLEYLREGAKNPFTDEPIKNEASPGNLTLRNTTNGMEVIWYDINGGPQPLATFPTRSK